LQQLDEVRPAEPGPFGQDLGRRPQDFHPGAELAAPNGSKSGVGGRSYNHEKYQFQFIGRMVLRDSQRETRHHSIAVPPTRR
jgi:hypothetical protein